MWLPLGPIALAASFHGRNAKAQPLVTWISFAKQLVLQLTPLIELFTYQRSIPII